VQTRPYYGCFPWERTEVGGDQLGAKHGGEEDMWVDAVVVGGSREMTDMQASEGEIIVGTF
jgi:hypothetical protein